MNFLQNSRLFKIVGIIAIIYFALFANKHNPNSLGNRLSGDKIKEDLSEAQERGKFIVVNVKNTQELFKAKEQEERRKRAKISIIDDPELVSFTDIKTYDGKDQIVCGSEVLYAQEIYAQNQSGVILKSAEKLVIGSKKNTLIEKALIGMGLNAQKSINIFSNYKSSNQAINDLIEKHNSDLKIIITVFEVKKPETTINCQ